MALTQEQIDGFKSGIEHREKVLKKWAKHPPVGWTAEYLEKNIEISKMHIKNFKACLAANSLDI